MTALGGPGDRGTGGQMRRQTWNAEWGVMLLLFLASLTPSPAYPQGVAAGRRAASEAVIRIASLTGSLRITTWPRESVAVAGRLDPGAGRFYLTGGPEALKLGVEPPSPGTPEGVADLDIRVPGGARLWVTTGSADLEITAAGGTVTVAGAGGRVRVAGRVAEASVETLDGNVELACDGAAARIRTASGTVVVRGVIQDLEASSVSGPLLIGMEGRVTRVTLETVSSEIAFKGNLVREGQLSAETHGGDIELRLPPELGAEWQLVSFGGGLRNAMVPPAAVLRGAHRGEWHFRTGDGAARVAVRTFKGTVTLLPRAEPPGGDR